MCGAQVISTSSSDAKINRLKSLGADFTLNYNNTPDWGRKARELAGRGVDLVVEVGGVGKLLGAWASVKPETVIKWHPRGTQIVMTVEVP